MVCAAQMATKVRATATSAPSPLAVAVSAVSGRIVAAQPPDRAMRPSTTPTAATRCAASSVRCAGQPHPARRVKAVNRASATP